MLTGHKQQLRLVLALTSISLAHESMRYTAVVTTGFPQFTCPSFHTVLSSIPNEVVEQLDGLRAACPRLGFELTPREYVERRANHGTKVLLNRRKRTEKKKKKRRRWRRSYSIEGKGRNEAVKMSSNFNVILLRVQERRKSANLHK